MNNLYYWHLLLTLNLKVLVLYFLILCPFYVGPTPPTVQSSASSSLSKQDHSAVRDQVQLQLSNGGSISSPSNSSSAKTIVETLTTTNNRNIPSVTVGLQQASTTANNCSSSLDNSSNGGSTHGGGPHGGISLSTANNCTGSVSVTKEIQISQETTTRSLTNSTSPIPSIAVAGSEPVASAHMVNGHSNGGGAVTVRCLYFIYKAKLFQEAMFFIIIFTYLK